MLDVESDGYTEEHKTAIYCPANNAVPAKGHHCGPASGMSQAAHRSPQIFIIFQQLSSVLKTGRVGILSGSRQSGTIFFLCLPNIQHCCS